MLRIRMRLPGRCFISSMDAWRPFISGMAMSITITSGSTFLTSAMPSRPLPASPMTVMSGSSSRMRRNPCRTRAWSSTRTSRMGCDPLCSANVCLLLVLVGDGRRCRHLQRHAHADDESGRIRGPECERAAHQLGAFPHADEPDALPAVLALGGWREPAAAVLDLELHAIVHLPEPHEGLGRSRVATHVGERLLHDAIDVNRRLGRDQANRAALLEPCVDAVLSPELLHVPRERLLQAEVVEHDRVE